MAESNGDWGSLAAHDDDMAQAWDACVRLPERGENASLDSFCERKRITIGALLRLGARLTEHEGNVLAFAYNAGLKYRNIDSGERWSYLGSEWPQMKRVPASREGSKRIALISEGETDGARLSLLYPEADVFILPAGARAFRDSYAEQVQDYDVVLAALDNDEAGEDGARKIAATVPHAIRFRPPVDREDWCETPNDEIPALPEEAPAPIPILVNAGDLLELESPDVASYFEQDLLPIGGLCILHGWAKSFKTFLGLDLMSAIAQGQPWCMFEPTEEPVKVGVVQFEIPWAYYKGRVSQLANAATSPDAFRENFLTYSPLARPQLIAGNTRQEDKMLKDLTDAGVQVLLFDPVRRAMGSASLNDENEVRKMLGFFERMNDEGITVIATHHDNKEGAKAGGGSSLSMTGSGAWAGDPDTIIGVELPKGDDLEASPRRNLIFLLRNAPSPSPRGMRINDEGHMEYQLEPHTEYSGEEANAPAI